MNITLVLAKSIIMSHNYHFFFLVRTLRVYSLSNFQVYNIVFLTMITMLYIRSPELISSYNCKFVPFDLDKFLSSCN